MNIKLHKFADSIALGEALAKRVCAALEAGINKRGKAVLAVSGGSTPKKFFQILSTNSIDWECVTITLVDERWVGEKNVRSNGRLVKENLLVNNAARASFVPLFTGHADIDSAMDELEADIVKLPMPFDSVILGMGNDGHTASFFPGGDNLLAAVDPAAKNLVSSMRAKGAGEPRVTFNLPVLAGAGFLALHIEGNDKLAVLDQALKDGDANAMPIRHVLRTAGQLEVFWAP